MKKIFFDIKSINEILHLYKENLWSLKKLGKKYKVSQPTIIKLLKEKNILPNKQADYRNRKNWSCKIKFTHNQKERIIFLYAKKLLSLKKIGEVFNCSLSPISRILKEEGIRIRNVGELNKGKHPTGEFKKGHPSQNKGRTNYWLVGDKNPSKRENVREKIRLSKLGKKRKPFSEEWKEKIRVGAKRVWENLEYKERVLHSQRKSMGIKPNNPEKIMIELIKENNLPFNYVGNGKVWFKGENHIFNPDFLSQNPKHIIEVFGEYHHTLPKNVERDKERLKTYESYGYKTLVIWSKELKNSIQVIEKINKFIVT